MESAESNREGESREKLHPVLSSVQEGSSTLLREKGGMKSAAPKSNKQQPHCTDHLTDTMLAYQGGCDTSSSLGLVRSNPSTTYDSKPLEKLSTNSGTVKLQAKRRLAHYLPPPLSPTAQIVPCPYPQESFFLDLVYLLLTLTQAFSSLADDHESKEDLGPDSRLVDAETYAVGFPIRPLEVWELAGERAVFGRSYIFSTVRLLHP
ncbi:unnamed protein product [Bubo scandiacus]